jgi:hypothetical protein
LTSAVVFVVLPAHAQQPSEPEATRFEFRAPDGCSSAAEFAARVSKRSARIRLVSDAGAQRSLVVEIQQPQANGALRGTVKVVEADGKTRTRQLKAASCAEAVDALSLIATVTLDPDAFSGEPPDETPKPEQVKLPEEEPKPPTRKPPPFRRAPPTEPYRFSFGLAGAVLLEMAPEPAWGGTASAAFEINPGGLAAPFWRVSLTHAQSRNVTHKGATAGFAYTLPTLDVCPVRLGPRVLGVRPCAFGTVGLLKAWGEGTPRNGTYSRLYGAAGVAVWAGLRVSEAFEIIADGRVALPFRRDEFSLQREVFFKTPTPGFSIGLGAAGGFP